MNYEKLVDDFLPWLKLNIPLLQHMEMHNLSFDGGSLSISAPLAPNTNDKGTGFAGSLATIATLSGWALVTLHLRTMDRDDAVVIHTSSLEYKKPVTGDFIAVVQLPDKNTLEQFDQRMIDKGRARINLEIEVQQNGESKLIMQGSYVAMPR